MSARRMKMSRRSFLKSGALAAAAVGFPSIVPRSVFGANAPSNRVNVGFIGCGAICYVGVPHYTALENCQITAMCDVKSGNLANMKRTVEAKYAENGRESVSGIKTYVDFRELLASPEIDAVYIATPDHWHVAMSLLAIKAGKDLHTEKPLAVSVEEVQAFGAMMKTSDRVFTLGTEGRAKEATRIGIQALRDGLLGKITDIVLVAPNGLQGGDPTPEPVPNGFDYNLWLGPAPEKPYCKDRVSRDGIFNISDYTLGPFSNWGIHAWDKVQMWATPAGVGIPVEYEGTAEFATNGLFDCPVTWRIKGRYANGIRFQFVDAKSSAPVVEEASRGKARTSHHHGAYVIGENGVVELFYDRVGGTREVLVAAKNSQNPLPAINNHYQDWVDCVLSRKTPISDWQSSVDGDMMFQLANIAIRSGKKVGWDPIKNAVVGESDVVAMAARQMREPFSLKTILKEG